MFKITLNNGKSYQCQPDQTIFEAARSNGIFLDHSCLSARCSACKVRVVNGDTKSVVDDSVLSSKERNEGYILSCNCKPLSDVIIDADDLTEYELQKPKTVPAKINSKDLVTPSVIKLVLRTPPSQKINFIEGQFVDIIKGTIRRSYSIANKSSIDGVMEFFIKNYEGGAMSNYLFGNAAAGDLLRIEGPKGTFFKRKSTRSSIIFLATGTGIAPINSILECLESENLLTKNEEIHVFWGVRYASDLFDLPILNRPEVNFYPILSRPDQDWNGKTGYVQEIAQQIIGNFADTEVYACGSDSMIRSAKKLLLENGLDESLFYSDAFVQTN